MEKVKVTDVVLVAFAVTACAGFYFGKLSAELFVPALMTVLAFYYGSKQGEALGAARAAGQIMG